MSAQDRSDGPHHSRVAEGPRGWGRPLHDHVLDAAGVQRGTALLDLGCGTGVFARAAADRGAHVTGIDLDRRVVARAAAQVPSGAFRVGDVHEPGGPDTAFDVVAAVQLIAHVTNPVRVLREAARVTRRSGRVAVTVWGREAECDVRAFGEALAPWLPPRTGPVTRPPPVTEPVRLRRLAGLARLVVQALDEVVCPFDYPDADAVLEPLYTSAMGRHGGSCATPCCSGWNRCARPVVATGWTTCSGCSSPDRPDRRPRRRSRPRSSSHERHVRETLVPERAVRAFSGGERTVERARGAGGPRSGPEGAPARTPDDQLTRGGGDRAPHHHGVLPAAGHE